MICEPCVARDPAADEALRRRAPDVVPAGRGPVLDVLALQRTAGNAAVCGALQRGSGVARAPLARCACGGIPGPDGECAACRAKRLAAEGASAEAVTAPAVSLAPRLQRQEVSEAPAEVDPARTARLDELLRLIREQTASNIDARGRLDALPPASSPDRDANDAELNAGRERLLQLLEERVVLLDVEIAGLNRRIGPAPVSDPAHPESGALGSELTGRELEQRDHMHQLGPLRRWSARRKMAAIDEEIAEIDAELATLPPVSDPNDPRSDLLFLRRFELEQRKQALARSLTSSAHEYEQFDQRWGARRYGTSPACTSVAEAGCGPTSLAIVLNYLYQEDPEGLAAGGNFEIVTPVETETYAETHGRVCNNGTAGDTMVTQVSTGFPGFRGQRITLAQATSQLRSGNLVIFLCHDCTGRTRTGGPSHYGGHFMVLNGVDQPGETFDVLDPGRGETSDIQTISRQELSSNAAGFWIVERQ